MKIITILSLVLSSLIFVKCDETKKVIDVAGTVQLSGNYTVVDLGQTTLGTEAMTFSFAAIDKSIRGYTGCNSFFGNYTIDLFALSFGEFAVSEKYCDEPVMISERALLKALQDTGSYSLQNNVLTLYSKIDRTIILKANKTTN
jgi:heat shock protein HslJ